MINMKEWADAIIDSPVRCALPIMTHPGIEMTGHKVVDAVTDGEVHCQAVVALNNRYPSAASTVIMDLTVEAEAFGAQVVFADNEVPSVVGRLVDSADAVDRLTVPSLRAARVPQYLKANRLIARAIPDKPLFGGAIGPFSLAGRLFDMTEIMMAIYTEPDTVDRLLSKCSDFLLQYIKAIKAEGASGIIMAEPAAGLLSNDDATRFSTRYIRPIVEAVQDDNFLFVLHNCGNAGHCTQSMIDTGARALHFGNRIDMVEALQQTPSDLLVMGNIDPVGAFKQSTPEQMAQITRDLVARTASYRNFVVSSGCDVPPGVSQANIEAFYSNIQG